jgi:hypothetical protein
MAQSVITLVMQQFGPTVLGKLSGVLGESQGATEKAVSGGIPALLAGLASAASKPGGADRLAGAVQQQDPGILDNLSTMLGSGAQQVSENGRSAMTSLLGGSSFDGLTGAISSFSGINRGSATSLIGLIAPVVMGVLGSRQKAAGADAGGLARMLLGEKDTIAAAMPPGMGQLLGASGILDSVRDRLAPVAGAAAKPVGAAAGLADASASPSASPPPASETVQSYAAKPTSPREGPARWWLGIAAAVILAVLAYWLWGNQGPRQVAQRPADHGIAGSSVPPAASSTVVGNVDVGQQLSGVVDRTSQALKSVTDATSAKNALPQLQEQIAQLDQMNGLAAQVPSDGKHALNGIVASGMPPLQQLMEKVEAIPGVADVLKPTLETLKTKLNAIGSQA